MRLLLLLIFLLFGPSVWSQNGRQGMDRALFFAVSQYQDDRLQHLPQTITNAREIAQILISKYGFTTEIVENPSLDDIEAKLTEYRKRYNNGRLPKKGQLLIFFSGHGVKEFNNGYFLPADANLDRILRTGLSYNTWRPFMSQINCDHLMVAVDACYSVTFDPQWNSMNGERGFHRVGELNETESILENHKRYPSRIFFTSDAREDIVPGRSNFARKFLEGLSGLQYTLPFATSSKLFADYIDKAQPSPKGGAFEGDDPRSAFLFFPQVQIRLDDDRYVRQQKDIEAYEALQLQPSITAYQKYLDDFPKGEFRTEVYNLLVQLREDQDWKLATLKNTTASYQNYLRLHPNGQYATQAKQKLKTPPDTPKSLIDLDNMVFVQGGTFQMGSKYGRFDETPHTVTISDFYLSRHEVTFEEYDTFCEASGRKKTDDEGWGRGMRPVINVTWHDAISYCNWLSEKHNLKKFYEFNGEYISPIWHANGYRLPTEAEWEYAARSRGKEQKWPGITEENLLHLYCNYEERGKKDGHRNTSPVGTFKANGIGLFDMSGNVAEWCWDIHKEDYYSISEGVDPKGPGSGSNRIIRGGSWRSQPETLRCAYRGLQNSYYRDPDLGFRLCKSNILN